MRFAFSTNAFRAYRLADALEAVSRCGFAAVEIAADVPHIYPWQPRSELAQIKSKLHQLNLPVSNINAFTMFWCGDMQQPSWLTPHRGLLQRRIEHTVWALEVASELGAPSISTQPGGPVPEGMGRDEALKRFIDGLRQVAPTARRLGVRILVEPEPELLIETVDDFLWFWEAADDLHDICGLNFDVGHMVCAGVDPSSAFGRVKEIVRHIHIEDIKGRRHYHLIPGEGEIDYERFFATLQQYGYDGFLSLELYTYQHMPEEAGRKGLAHLRRYVGAV